MTPRDAQPKRLSLRRRTPEPPAVDGLSDNDLVERSRAGEEAAYAELWRRHSRAGLAVARSASSSLDPEDLVAEAFTKIFQAVRDGKGPQLGFRPYLFTTIRNLAASWGRDRKESPLEDAEAIPDPETTESTTMHALDRSLTAQAFRSLPDRWQEVLWYCDIEQLGPAEVAPLLGLSANGVSALAYRAREGLRQAWIQVHLQSLDAESECRWVTDRMGTYTRGKLATRETVRFERHLFECARCTIVLGEAREVGSRLALIVLPLTVGAGAATAYAAWIQGGHNALASSASAASPLPSSVADTISSAGSAGGATAAGGAVAGGVTVAAWSVGGALLAAAAVAGTFVLAPQLFPGTGGGSPAGPPVAAAPAHPRAPGAAIPVPATPGEAPPAAEPPPGASPGSPADPPGPSAPPTSTDPTISTDPAAPSAPGATSAPVAPSRPTAPTGPTDPTAPTTPTDPSAPVEPRPPAAPVVTSPWDAAHATAALAVDIAGTGVPGATVTVTARPAAGPDGTAATASAPALGTAVVDATGAWRLSADLHALTDGPWTMALVQTTADGSSTPTTLGLVIDRTALPPVIASVDTGTGDLAGRMAPIVSGTAEPGAVVVVSDGDRELATVTADAAGVWSTGELILASPSYALGARQTDPAGNVSAPSAAVTGTASAPVVLAIGAPHVAVLVVRGDPGSTVEVWLDGQATGRRLTLDGAGYGFTVIAAVPGEHRVGAVLVSGDRHGVLADTSVRVGGS
ncbi:sigma-70 family RNA polymerase sigma factor [Leifsonia aquatica]|uniref:sigma-70 family RNA polymerase sigma factor n=1 Tax=Leifsonia aquatica TaxID=144185 RepID=UPI0004694B8B|nr:sigma-70 family RNA polymerase sigma factor [Leifsonia aquatica]